MKHNKNTEDVNYWKLQYEELRKQKRLFYTNNANSQLVQQLQEKCLKYEQTIEKLNQLIKFTPTSGEDESEIIKLQYKQQLEEKDSLILILQRDNLNIQKVALEHLKKSDLQIDTFRIQCNQLKLQIDENNKLINHLQQKLKQEQLETIEFKEKIVISEKMNETLEQTVEKLNQDLLTAKEKCKKELSQMLQKYKQSDQEYTVVKNKINELSKILWGKYGTENMDIQQMLDKMDQYFNQILSENKEAKKQISQLTADIIQLTNKNQQLENDIQQLNKKLIQLQNEQEQQNNQKIDEPGDSLKNEEKEQELQKEDQQVELKDPAPQKIEQIVPQDQIE